MRQDIEEDVLIKKYLLGFLPQEEQLQVEERLFFDRKFLQMSRVVEDDLIDEYLYEELSQGERENFERHFLSTPERREALRIAKALKSYISANPVLAPPVAANQAQRAHSAKPSLLSTLRFQNLSWKLPLAFAALLAIACLLWLLIIVLRTPDRTRPVQEAQQTPPPGRNQNSPPQEEERRTGNANPDVETQNRQGQYAEQKKREPSGREVARRGKGPVRRRGPDEQVYPTDPQPQGSAEPTHVALLTPSGPTRGGGSINEVNAPVDVKTITLQLPLVEDAGYESYQAILTSDDSRVRRSWKGRSITDPKARQIVSITMPAQFLRQQNYRIKLVGLSPSRGPREIQTFYFRVPER